MTTYCIVCTNYVGKDKFSNGQILNHQYSEVFPAEPNFRMVIWSDGLTGEFKNKFSANLLEELSCKFRRDFCFNFWQEVMVKGSWIQWVEMSKLFFVSVPYKTMISCVHG